ncbi:PREDICTED: uncharacterized protein LOC100635221 [Amphimedon queenslandica]|uniref:Uncharacterized protein n=1 Tax=Amphimedon queenslandica TaxID=400682 RepID=A0A1X7VEU5_AMPQE|nr:PREDICTED: uncharacterized protein LOC100635221 [Amphimedon queenslandica]|eukprot:XP_003384517.1 PREDICTED: uncharacterized protein LOC100635221 [Amphimedon queenslandica]
MSTNDDSTPFEREREPLLQPETPPPSYHSLNCGGKPPPTYQQSHRPKNNYIGPPPIRGPSSHQTLVAIVYFCCFLSPTTWLALYYSARVQENNENGNVLAASKASRKTCLWSSITLVIGWIIFLFIVAVGTFVLTCYKLHKTCELFKSF